MIDSYTEKRREPRRPGRGAVRISWENPRPYEVEGRLRDYSPSGFRMRHASHDLTAGQLVEFMHFSGKGRARVVWNRITGEEVETGFLVVSEG